MPVPASSATVQGVFISDVTFQHSGCWVGQKMERVFLSVARSALCAVCILCVLTSVRSRPRVNETHWSVSLSLIWAYAEVDKLSEFRLLPLPLPGSGALRHMQYWCRFPCLECTVGVWAKQAGKPWLFETGKFVCLCLCWIILDHYTLSDFSGDLCI